MGEGSDGEGGSEGVGWGGSERVSVRGTGDVSRGVRGYFSQLASRSA